MAGQVQGIVLLTQIQGLISLVVADRALILLSSVTMLMLLVIGL